MPFQNKNYRYLWLANLIASFSGHVSMIAFPLVAIRHLNATAWEMGLLIAVEVLPFVIFSLPAGTLVDRFNTHRIVMWCFGMLALAVVIVPLAFALGFLSLPLLYLAGFFMGAVMCIEGVAAQVLTTELVSRKGLVEANSWMMGAESGLKLIAPALGGMMVELLGAPMTLWCEVVLLGIAFAVLAQIKHTGEREKPASVRTMELIREGVAVVWNTPVLRTAAFVVMLWQFVWHGVYALLVLYVTKDLGFSAAQLGLMSACGAAGVLMATLTTQRFEQSYGLGKGMIIGLGLAGIGWALMAAATPLTVPGSAGRFALMTLAYVVMDFGLSVGFVCYISLRQSVTEDRVLGRVVATMRWLNLLLAPLGGVVFGAIASGVSTATALGIAAAACSVLALGAWATALREVKPNVADEIEGTSSIEPVEADAITPAPPLKA